MSNVGQCAVIDGSHLKAHSLPCWWQHCPSQTPHAKAGQTQITLLETSITGLVFALARGVEKYFYEIRVGGVCSTSALSVSKETQTSRRGTNCCEMSLKQREIRSESLTTAFVPTGTAWLQEEFSSRANFSNNPTSRRHIRSILRHGRHDELRMNSHVSVGAEQIGPRDWTRPALHIWETAKAGFGLPSLPPTCDNNLIAPQAF